MTPERPFAPWLARAIATPACHRRAAQTTPGMRRASEVHDPIAYSNHAEDSTDFVQAIVDHVEAGRLRAAIAPCCRRDSARPWKLLGLEEHTLEQASHVTGSSKVALKVNFWRALRSLRTRLESNADV